MTLSQWWCGDSFKVLPDLIISFKMVQTCHYKLKCTAENAETLGTCHYLCRWVGEGKRCKVKDILEWQEEGGAYFYLEKYKGVIFLRFT